MDTAPEILACTLKTRFMPTVLYPQPPLTHDMSIPLHPFHCPQNPYAIARGGEVSQPGPYQPLVTLSEGPQSRISEATRFGRIIL